MKQFEVGATVQLRSGGPVMTVRIQQNGVLTCDWFAGDKAESASFFPGQLKEATPFTV